MNSPGSSRGFALVITIALLAFLVLLLAGVTSLTRLETAATGVTEWEARARQNALLALDLAVGRLQATAGPDARATASSDAYVDRTHLTGVWSSTDTGAAPLTWLVSGNEGEGEPAVTPESTVSDPVLMVGVKTSGVDNDVLATRRSLRSTHWPGQRSPVTVGHYAWWIGDQGVKASTAMPDRRDRLTYAPFDHAETSRRIRQQLAFGVLPDAFDPQSERNAASLANALIQPQLAFCQAEAGDRIGPQLAREQFHAWSTRNFAVLANSRDGGLRRDLSLKPDLLGSAFAAWADYRSYMEDPTAPIAPSPSPAYSASEPWNALRRRYRFVPAQVSEGIVHGIAPVLTHFLLTFNVRTDQSAGGANRPLEARARWMASLWNPYTSALVPEDLQLEVTGLPTVEVVDDASGGTLAAVPLETIYGSPLRIQLPWQTAGRPDQQSWLPGRTYSWTSLELLNKTDAMPADGFASQFYVKNFNVAGQGVQRLASSNLVSNAARCHLAVPSPTQLTLRLYRSIGAVRELLATFHAPEFASFTTTPAGISAATYQFSFFFRLAESIDTVAAPETWLVTSGQDPRETDLPAGSYVPGANGNRPEQYVNFTSSSFPDRLLDRSFPVSATSLTGQSYNEDTPLFELPRAPLLSLGALQHLHPLGARPFSVGNSWGASGGWNAVYDRYFFSGLAAEVALPDLSADVPLPNVGLSLMGRKANGTAITRADLLACTADGYSSKYLLQGGAFNLNSTQAGAWRALLRSGRHRGESGFTLLDASAATGTASDDRTLGWDLPGAVFFRFSHSAQETAKADAGYAASTTIPPARPNVASLANTHLFRNGVRSLTEEQTTVFADTIVLLLQRRLQNEGPFRSVEEFLNPSSLFISAAGQPVSLLEKAIEQAQLNDGTDEFSSQWLTQADVMTVLAPVLFARSDTFLIRVYGDATNPVTGAIEGRVWAEAIAQRQPELVDPTQSSETATASLNPTNTLLGRRFHVVFFRWLSVFDL